MSSAHRPQHEILKTVPQGTDTSGMQAMFELYTAHLPQKASMALPSNCSKVFAVVGSTGFLGPYIIASLLRSNNCSQIFCLNRTLDAQQRTESALHQVMGDFSPQRSRLHYQVTDMTQPDFGLTALQAGMLSSRVDELIFNAWDPHWGKELAYFEPFLEGIRNSIEFCATASRRPRITFISTVCAVGNWSAFHPTEKTIPEAVVWDNRSAGTHGYGESKCVAEQVLAKGQEVSGVPVSVIRAGQIGGPSHPSMGAWPRQGWLCSIIMASKRLKVFPTHVTPLDWIPVDILADGIANSTLRCPSSLDVEVFNAVHPRAVSWSLFYRTLQSRFGFQAVEEHLQAWLDRFDHTGMNLHGFLSAMEGGREFNMAFHNRKALEVLPQVPQITEDLLATWLSGWNLRLGDSSAKL
jgi:thioester reductase-like protein